MIPHRIHFTYTTVPDTPGKPFAFIHYLAIKSAAQINQCPIVCHCETEPAGPYWQMAKRYMTPVMTPVPREIAGIPLRHPAHRSDVLRLQVLLREGGIYLDLDIICSRPFTDLLGHHCVLGRENAHSICTGVILAEPESVFLRSWLDGYDPKTSLTHGFRSQGYDRHWAEMSSRYATLLADRHPELVTVMPERQFHFPFIKADVEQMFLPDKPPIPDAYCYHLFESMHWNRYSHLTADEVRAGHTNFYALLSRYLDQED